MDHDKTPQNWRELWIEVRQELLWTYLMSFGIQILLGAYFVYDIYMTAPETIMEHSQLFWITFVIGAAAIIALPMTLIVVILMMIVAAIGLSIEYCINRRNSNGNS